MSLAAFVAAAALAAPSAEGARVTSQHFHEAVLVNAYRACRRYLTPAARRQWDRTVQTEKCSRRRPIFDDSGDRFRHRVIARPAPDVARVERALIDESAICIVDGEKLYLARTDTLVHRHGRWRIARFGFDATRCVP